MHRHGQTKRNTGIMLKEHALWVRRSVSKKKKDERGQYRECTARLFFVFIDRDAEGLKKKGI